MNEIRRSPVGSLGYHFIPAAYLPAQMDEYYLRNRQNQNGIQYRQLNAYEIEVLVRNRNMSDDWNKILVSDAFNPELVQDCKFYGLVRIGRLEPWYLEFHNLKRPVGLYNSTIISCDLGNNVVVDNVNYLSHYIIGNEVILVNINEIATTSTAKFGNGILKEGEPEAIRIWLEVCNENGGRKIQPFNGMQPGDAWLWSRSRGEAALQEQFARFTALTIDAKRGYYGMIGDRTVIKNTKIVKDVNIGTDAYIKGANKIKNVTINSSAEAGTQIGEGCELVNGIIEYGCRIFYGVKAVRFFLASHSQLKYGARLINSYLGNNSTISCCEVLNSLIFPSHEQHHNNSFLCAALLQGQSNMAAGATIGSNHNSRSPDGEIVAGRGFWPGLCVSLKHNSKFACFSILAKGDYPAELNISIPFSLVSNDVHNDELLIMPAYWFMYNMYALARNAWKYRDRDNRKDPIQQLEFDYLAPDTINEILQSLPIMEEAAGMAWLKNVGKKKRITQNEAILEGQRLLSAGDPSLEELPIFLEGAENSQRKVRLIKLLPAYRLFKELIAYYTAKSLLDYLGTDKKLTYEDLADALPARPRLLEWDNVGGQLIPSEQVDKLRKRIENGTIRSWDKVHEFYRQQASLYPKIKLEHAWAAYREAWNIRLNKQEPEQIASLLQDSINTREWMTRNIYESREKDYSNPFRKMVYDSTAEMDAVIGKLRQNSFIRQETAALEQYRKQVNKLKKLINK